MRLLTAPEPLIPIAILGNPRRAPVDRHQCLRLGVDHRLNIFLPTYLQTVVGLSPTDAGLSLVALMVTLNTSAAVAGQMIRAG